MPTEADVGDSCCRSQLLLFQLASCKVTRMVKLIEAW